MTIEVLNPTYDEAPSAFASAERAGSLAGRTVGIVSNGKHGTVPFFAVFADELRTAHGVAEVVQVIKPNYSAPAGDALLGEAQTWHALVAGIGD